MKTVDRPHTGKSVSASRPGPSLKPKDSATLVLVRHDGEKPRILMGKRNAKSTFLPDVFVFPGGRVDKADSRVIPASGLDARVEAKLLTRMRGRPSAGRARALAMAAIRETFEETGIVIGAKSDRPASSTHPDWAMFLATGMRPTLSPMRFIARAITPPGRVRRFDSRFFTMDVKYAVNIDNPHDVTNDELTDIHWLTFAKTEELDLPWITRQVLKYLEAQLEQPEGLAPGGLVSFQYQRGKKWFAETL